MLLARSARRTPFAMLAAALAVAALIGQALLPHVHTWQSGGHDAELRVVRGVGPASLATDVRHDVDHDRAVCPTCQALTQSRELAAASRATSLAIAVAHAGFPIPFASSAASPDVAASAAPRAPPASA